MKVPFKFYADLECIFKKCESECESEDKNSSSSWSVNDHDHVACGCGYKDFCADDKFTKDAAVYRATGEQNEQSEQSERKTSGENDRERGRNCINVFIKSILSEF